MKKLSLHKMFFKALFTISLLFAGFNNLSAQVTILSNWLNQYHGTSQTQQTISYPVSAGTDARRLLVVAIAADRTAVGAVAVSITYGGQTMTPLNGDIGLTTARQHTQLYYLNEAGLDAAGANTNLVFTISGGTTRINDVWAAVFDNVNQFSPFTDSRNYTSINANTSSFTLSPALNINTNDLAFEVASCVRIASLTQRILTYSTNWTLAAQQTYAVTDAVTNVVVNRSVPASDVTDAATITINNGTNTRGSLTGASLRVAPTIATGTITGSPFCAGAAVSVPYTITGLFGSGNVFTAQLSDASGSFASPTTIGASTSTNSGTISAVFPVGTITGSGYRIRVVGDNPSIIGTDNGVNITINALPAVPVTTGGNICIGSTAILSATGATTGDRYVWYDAASAGNVLKTSADNADNTYTTAVLSITTNYWVSILSASGCESSRTQVTATFPAVSGGNQSDAGTNSWIGHIYDGTNLNTYYGTVTASEIFDQSFGGGATCFPFTSGANTYSINTEQFSVRYRMNSTKRGLYVVDLGSDDGSRLNVDGTLLYNNWVDQAYSSRPRVLMNLTGASTLAYDFYENGGENRVVFQNLTQVLANTLTANTTQSIPVGSSGAAIAGDVYGTLPTGISLSGTGYEWTYSTTPGGARTVISGATGATFTPNATVAPFNTAGTYYIFRNAALSSLNNTAMSPYVATSESNYATLVVYNIPLITVNPNSLTGFTYLVGNGPSAQQSFTVNGNYLIDNITITPSANYEISTTSGSGFQSTPITLAQSAGVVANTTLYVRLKAGLSVNTYNSENIISTSSGAVTKNVTCSGSVVLPLITTSISTLSGFSYDLGSGPSSEQTFTVNGSSLTQNITVTPSTNFEISTTSGSGYQSTPITLTQTGGTVATTTIYVRLKAGLAIGTYASQNITVSSTGATTKNVAVSGSVYATYCSSVPVTGLRYISNVTLNTISNTSGQGTYNNNTGISTNIIQGSSYNLSVRITFTQSSIGYLYAWIDWNKDGDFSDANETYNMGNTGTSTTPVTLTRSVSVPATAVSGKTRIRIAVSNTTTTNPCSTGFSGEVEDYSINTILSTITTGTITGSPFTVGASVSVPFTISGGFVAGNIFTAQLSNSSGSFASPVSIGTLTSTSAGTISATIPANAQNGTGYRIRVVASSPAVVGTDNGTNLIITGGVPTITATPLSISTFTYPVGYGPSVVDSIVVSGINLIDNIRVLPTTDFDISTTNSPFTPSSLITLSVSNASVLATKIYVRMKSGLALGAVAAQNITFESDGAASKSVACSGTVVDAPVITTSLISGSFSYIFGSGPSAARTFTVSGIRLGGSVVITPPTNYEISTNGGTDYFSTPISLPINSGNAAAYTGVLNSTTITIRLKIALGTGAYSENVVASSINAESKSVALSGTVNASATLTTIPSYLGTFTYTVGFGNVAPFAEQSFVVTGSNLTGNVTITPPVNFQISTTSGAGYVSNPSAITLTPSGGNVNAVIYARLAPGLAVGVYGTSNVQLTSAGAVVKTVGLYGEVLAVTNPQIFSSKNVVNGFGYMQGTGPSGVQSFTVSAASLSSQNLTVTLSDATYEMSLNANSGFQSTPITLPGTAVASSPGTYKVTPTTIYLRLKAGNLAGNYLKTITLSAGSTTKVVSLVGIVFVSPLITAGGGGEYCQGSTINLTSTGADVQNRYWTGPNSFYSSEQNPVITNATTAMSGTYTVTGNVPVSGNLIYNGDFESGSVGFGSSYVYVTPSSNALQPESRYTVVKLPGSVHNDFTNHPDHTTGSGYQMVVNGSPTAGVVVWTQSVPVVPGATYEFSYWEQTVNMSQYPKNASQLQLYVNGVAAGPVYTAPQDTLRWANFIYNAEAGVNTVMNLELINQNTVASGNDFALDDISFKQILPATSSTNVTVNPVVPVGISIAASPGTTVYSNTPVTFTATPTNGGAAPTYQWRVNGNPVGTNSVNYTYTPVQGDVVTCTLTSSLTCVTNNPATATLNMTVILRTNYWYGYVSTDWGNAANWTGKYVPAAGEDVEYATLANTPDSATFAVRDLWLDQNRIIGSLINATTRRLVIPANKTLSCNNIISVTPPLTNPVTNKEDLIYIYASTTLANGSIIYRNPSQVPAYGTVEMYSPASWNKSNAVNNKYNWQFFGIPVTSVSALPTFYGAYVRELLESDNDTATHWRMLTNESVLQPFVGYELCQQSPAFYTFKGQLINSNFNSGQFVKTTGALYPGQHLFANPYTSAIDIRQIEFGTNVEATAYLYNTGTFTKWKTNPTKSVLLESPVPGQYNSAPKLQAGQFAGIPRQIPSMGTFMVRIPSANASTAQSYVAMSYNSVAMGNTDKQRAKAYSLADEQATTSILVEGEYGVDKMWIMTNENYSRTFDNGYDGLKLAGNALNPQLYAVEQDGKYQINSVDDLNNTTLAFQAGLDTEYKISFNHDDKTRLKYKKIFLHDLVENRVVDITFGETEYVFNATTTPDPVLRFKIIAQKLTEGNKTVSNVKVYHFDNQIYVQNFSEHSGKVHVYDISGRLIGIQSISANGNIQIPAPKNSVYIVKTVVDNKTETFKLVLN